MSLIAKIQGITRARVWQLYHEYLSTGKIPKLKKPGRKRKEISDEEKNIVLEKYDQYKRRYFEGIDELTGWYNLES